MGQAIIFQEAPSFLEDDDEEPTFTQKSVNAPAAEPIRLLQQSRAVVFQSMLKVSCFGGARLSYMFRRIFSATQ
ncbi:MAG: hypothetical protein KatS3mg048_0599 [Caldilinea sp.]|jgi:hypothetical protein|nr:MAG: hypothetical protein KatS3mg048_0599 [Caldilinea sp.]